MIKIKNRHVIIAGVAAVLAATSNNVHGQDAAQDAKLHAAMSASAYASFSAAIKDAKARGLPAEPLVAKGIEGAAKNVPGDRIVIAVRATADRMGRAQLLLRSSRPTTSAEIVAVADALQRNVPEDALRKLSADAAGRATIAVTSYALADLMASGVPLAVGVEVIGAWRAGGGDAAMLKEVPATIERLMRQGVAPARAGAGVAAGLKLGTPLSRLTPVNLPR
ncbi:MAG: hypothetical protein ABIV28_05540 [Longimicrobiales bacterium]